MRFADWGVGGLSDGGMGGGRDNDAVFDPDFVSEIKGTQGLTSYVWSDIVFTISPKLENEMTNRRLNCKFMNCLFLGIYLCAQCADFKNG